MSAEKLHSLSVDELYKELLNLRKEKLNLRFRQANSELDNTARIREVRKNIARIKTILAQKQK